MNPDEPTAGVTPSMNAQLSHLFSCLVNNHASVRARCVGRRCQPGIAHEYAWRQETVEPSSVSQLMRQIGMSITWEANQSSHKDRGQQSLLISLSINAISHFDAVMELAVSMENMGIRIGQGDQRAHPSWPPVILPVCMHACPEFEYVHSPCGNS